MQTCTFNDWLSSQKYGKLTIREKLEKNLHNLTKDHYLIMEKFAENRDNFIIKFK
jgi:hypothetical protein